MELIPSASVSAAEAVHFHSLLRHPLITLQDELKEKKVLKVLYMVKLHLIILMLVERMRLDAGGVILLLSFISVELIKFQIIFMVLIFCW